MWRVVARPGECGEPGRCSFAEMQEDREQAATRSDSSGPGLLMVLDHKTRRPPDDGYGGVVRPRLGPSCCRGVEFGWLHPRETASVRAALARYESRTRPRTSSAYSESSQRLTVRQQTSISRAIALMLMPSVSASRRACSTVLTECLLGASPGAMRQTYGCAATTSAGGPCQTRDDHIAPARAPLGGGV